MKYRAVLLFLSAVLGTNTFAQSGSTNVSVTRLDPIVVTGSPVETTSFDTPYSVDATPVNPSGNAQLGVNASEVLTGVPGLVVQNRQNFAQDLQISIRGFGARSPFGVRGLKLIADGIPASIADGQGQVATFNLDTAERIEVLRGPFATIYGNSSGGVIQLFSRNGEGPPGIRAGANGGSWGTWKTDFGSEGEVKGLSYVLDLSHFETDGYRKHSAAERDQFFTKMSFAPDTNSLFTIVASGLEQPNTQDPLGVTTNTYKQNPRAVETNAIFFNTRKTIEHAQVGATYERHLNEQNQIELDAYSGVRSVTQFQAIPPGPQANTNHSGGVIDFDRSFYGAGARWIAEPETPKGSLKLTAGLDFDGVQDDRRGYENFVGSTFGVKGALRRDEIDTVNSVQPYLQGVWDIGKWQWSAGVRYSWVEFNVDDHYLANGDDSGKVDYEHATPAFGLLFRATDKINFYGSIGAGFETPTMNELSYSTNGGFNFALKPSTSIQSEIGAKAFIGENTRVNAALFQIDTEDEIVVNTSSGGRTTYRNAAKTLRQGVELSAESDFTCQLTAKGSLTWLRAVYESGSLKDNHIPGIPEFAAYGELEWRPCKGVTTGIEAIYRDQLYVEDQNSQRPAPGYLIGNLWVSTEQNYRHWKFTEMVRLDNIADEKYIGSVIVGDSNGRYYEPSPTRSVYAGVQIGYRF